MENSAGERTISLFGRIFPRNAFICRLFYLAYFASFGSLFPLLAVYFKQLGMTAAQTGMLLGCRPLIEFASGPFWASFANRFRKQKLLLLFSLGSWIVFTLAVGFVQPITPYCVVLVPGGNKSCQMMLVPAGVVVRGGALGMLKEAVVGRTRARRGTENQIIEKIIDLSTFDNEEDMVAGIAPEYITRDQVCNYDESEYGVLVSPPHSTRVYRQPAVEQAFMLLLLLIALGEFFSSPALVLADAATLNATKDNPQEFGKIRLFASVGWGLAMFVMGVGLDYSDTFRNHPCPTTNTTEKNYTLCFVMCSIFMCAAMLLATQFKFDDETARPDEVVGLVMDTRESEVSHVVAEKARARQVQADAASESSVWIAAKALSNTHILIYLASVTTMGFGAGVIFTFLYWHLQDIGGSPILFGILSVVNHASEIVAYFFTFQVINKYGHVKVMYICLGVNVCRFVILSWLDNPWMVVPLQVLQGFALATAWASASSYISLIAPPHIKSSAQYIIQLLYHGVGKGVGSIVSGTVISVLGTRLTFLLYALLCAVMCGGGYGLNKLFKYEGIKYGTGMFDEDEMDIMGKIPSTHNIIFHYFTNYR
uniref:MFS domain-containing protein n=1 Tax=Angiostrongylus cantonensis TaxID=6313 RepID=A0A158PCI4_ANGCA